MEEEDLTSVHEADDPPEYTALTMAIFSECFSVADELIEKDTEKEFIKKIKGRSSIKVPFIFSLITHGKIAGCKYLIEKGLIDKDVLTKDKLRLTPLIFAIMKGEFKIADYLIEIGANINHVKTWQCPVDKASFPFHLINIKASAKTLRYIIDKKLFDKDVKDYFGISLLMHAISNERFDIVTDLTKREADLEYVKKWRSPPPAQMPFFSFQLLIGKEKACKFLLERNLFDKGSIKAEIEWTNPLIFTINQGHFDIADLLIEKGISIKGISLTSLMEGDNVLACQYAIENKLLTVVDEEDIGYAKKKGFSKVTEYLNKIRSTEISDLSAKISRVFLSMPDCIEEITLMPFNVVRIRLNSNYLHYSQIVKNIGRSLASKKYITLEGRPPIKSFLLKGMNIKDSDLELIVSAFKLEEKTVQTQQTQPSLVEKGTEPFFGSPLEKEETYSRGDKIDKTSFCSSKSPKKYQQTKQELKKKPKAKSHKKPPIKTTTSVRKISKKPIKTITSTSPSTPPRDMLKGPGGSLLELIIVKTHLKKTDEKTIPVFPEQHIETKQEILSFNYYRDKEKSTINTFTLPPNKENHVKSIVCLCNKVMDHLKIAPEKGGMYTQAFLYDLFLLLELIQKTFDGVEKIQHLISINSIKQLRGLMKKLVFNQQKQNVNLKNIQQEAEKICGRLCHICTCLKENKLTKIESLSLKIDSEDLIIFQTQNQYSLNLSFFKEYNPLVIERRDVYTYVDEFLSYIAIIEDEHQKLDQKSLVLSAAKWCVLALDKTQAIFEEGLAEDKALLLADIFLNLHTARNQLAHSETSKDSGEVRDFDTDEKIILELKNLIIQLRQEQSTSQQFVLST